ncbi:hypothetical protein [Kordiimonas aquimaris]|uniref:hypothetical protein n=1 Tax=Kordiimonas aquimaris TaxID=707591 RepID=UPI0021D14FB2|nr:hypothetical protein [Kordiimonas aquimaris]
MSFLALSPAHADRQKQAQKAFTDAQYIVTHYRDTLDNEKLFEADRLIESAWRDLKHFYGTTTALSSDLALIRARSASSRKDKARVTEAWQTALSLQPANLPAARRLSLNIAAANATGTAGDVQSSTRYFAAARTYAFSRDKDAKELQLRLRLQELKLVGASFPWRKLNDNLLDMRNFSEGFAMWTLPRLDALLGEAELRLSLEPEKDHKRNNLADLKAKIILLTKGMEGNIPPNYIERVRNFYYAIEDYYDL